MFDEEEAAPPKGFLYSYGAYLVYLVSVIGLALNLYGASRYFRAGRWGLAVWSLAAVGFLPRGTFGLVMLLGKDSGISLNIPALLRNPGVYRSYRWDSPLLQGREYPKALFEESLFLAFGLLPGVLLFIGWGV